LRDFVKFDLSFAGKNTYDIIYTILLNLLLMEENGMLQLNKISMSLALYALLLFFAVNAYATNSLADAKHLQLSGHIEHGVRIIEVQAFKYGYNPDPIVIKAGEKVKLLLTSKDVTHGFGIADLNINVKIPPKKTTTFEFVVKKAGSYRIYCTVFCGLGHPTMHGTLVIIK
jgi:cytochrome c oxidase subunit II